MGAAPWAIVDFPGPDGRPVRETFRDPVAVVETRLASEVTRALSEAERLARGGLTLVGFVAYDAAPGLEPKFEIRPGYDGPLVWFMACDVGPEGRRADKDEHPVRAPEQAGSNPLDPSTTERWAPDFDANDYKQKVLRIIEGIERGDFYQVNLTERFSAPVHDPLAVYERIRLAQSARYSTFIQTAEMTVLSVSPELFLRRKGHVIESHPMKGTARRGRWTEEDDEFALSLAMSEKERAENVMIVDLIRNDMGRIAVPGSVEVPSMFTVEKYPTVLQMTSHVKSQLEASTSLAEIFAALFPCGSVTGAPKIAASKSIAALEFGPRGLYCGAVGVIRAGAEDFTFNVAIRTAVVDSRTARGVYGAGGGITADSNPDRELAELEAKAAVLTSMPREVSLLETMRLESGMIERLALHLERLHRSATYFGFLPLDTERMERDLASLARSHAEGVFRVRVVLRISGDFDLTVQPHRDDSRDCRLGLSRMPVLSTDPYLYHKLADRSAYTERLAEVKGVDDVALLNERGELTETTIGNLILELGGRRLTPALDCGLLPGVLRQTLLASGEIVEAILTPEDLKRATRVWRINSLRGWVNCLLV